MRILFSRARAKAQEQSVLQAVQNGPMSGFEVSQFTGLSAGTVYPILHRLEENGAIVSEWEQIDPEVAGRPARKFYSSEHGV